MRHAPICLLLLTLSIAGAGPARAVENLFTNGNLEEPKPNQPDSPSHWGTNPEKGITWESEEDNRFLRLTSPEPDAMVGSYRQFPISPEQVGLNMRLRFKMRSHALQAGHKPWLVGTLFIAFKDNRGNAVESVERIPSLAGTHEHWQQQTLQFVVPQGASKLEVIPVLNCARSGSIDFDDFTLKFISASDDPMPWPAETGDVKDINPSQVSEAEKAQWRARNVDFPINGGKPHPLMLKTAGNKVIDTNGNEIWLQGINVPSLGWSATGEFVFPSTVIAIEEWNANVIRLAVQTRFWFGHTEFQKDGGTSYRKLVDKLVEATASRGAYLLLDLHEFRAVRDQDLEFWTDAAARYKNHPAVIFGLFNEPHGISWDVWKNGGEVTEQVKLSEGVVAENDLKYETFRSPGMQACMDAVRATGAMNVCTVGGIAWAGTLAGILDGFAIDDRGGNGIIYEAHCYNWKNNWTEHFLNAAEQYPVIIGETGADIRRMRFLPDEIEQEDPFVWVPDMLGCIQKYRLHWTAWCFHPASAPRMLKDWNFTPTPFWGQFAKDALAGKQFEIKKMR